MYRPGARVAGCRGDPTKVLLGYARKHDFFPRLQRECVLTHAWSATATRKLTLRGTGGLFSEEAMDTIVKFPFVTIEKGAYHPLTTFLGGSQTSLSPSHAWLT